MSNNVNLDDIIDILLDDLDGYDILGKLFHKDDNIQLSKFTKYKRLKVWSTRTYDSKLYFVKDMGNRPKIGEQFIDYIKKNYGSEINKLVSELDYDVDILIEEILSEIFEYVFSQVDVFYEEEFAPFVKKLGYKPAVVGRSGRWWGIELDTYGNYISSKYFNVYSNAFKDIVEKEVKKIDIKNMSDDDIARVIADNLDYERIKDIVIMDRNFERDMMKIDNFLEDVATFYETPENIDLIIRQLIETYA